MSVSMNLNSLQVTYINSLYINNKNTLVYYVYNVAQVYFINQRLGINYLRFEAA